jgi:hypothetical protein
MSFVEPVKTCERNPRIAPPAVGHEDRTTRFLPINHPLPQTAEPIVLIRR